MEQTAGQGLNNNEIFLVLPEVAMRRGEDNTIKKERMQMNCKSAVFQMVLLPVLITLMLGSFVFGKGESQNPPDEMVIKNEGYKKHRKGPVPFSHLSHAEDYDIACNECHHRYKEGKNVWKEGDPVEKCVSCHSPLESKGKVKKLKLAFHKNCKNCHRRMAKEGITKDAPFRSCRDCHEKKK